MPEQKRKQKDTDYPGWFDQQPTNKCIEHFKDAAVNYILDKKISKNPPTANVEVCKSMLKWIVPFERKWKDVTIDNFNTKRHKAH